MLREVHQRRARSGTTTGSAGIPGAVRAPRALLARGHRPRELRLVWGSRVAPRSIRTVACEVSTTGSGIPVRRRWLMRSSMAAMMCGAHCPAGSRAVRQAPSSTDLMEPSPGSAAMTLWGRVHPSDSCPTAVRLPWDRRLGRRRSVSARRPHRATMSRRRPRVESLGPPRPIGVGEDTKRSRASSAPSISNPVTSHIYGS